MASDTKRVLVTGAAGFIGSFVAARLADMGFEVVGADNFNTYYTPELKWSRVHKLLEPRGVPCKKIELADASQTAVLFERVKPTYVVHLAAQAGVRYSIDHPSAYIQSNLVAFANILEACRAWKPLHLVYASSSSIYGANHKVPFQESGMTDEPVSLYAATKKSNELMAYSYSHLFGLPCTGLRFFTVYGPWGRPDMAYFSFAEKMLRGEPIPVFARGELQRDFTYIDDIVEGIVRVMAKPQVICDGKAAHAVFNIGNHQPVRVMEFIATLEEALGVKANIDFLPMQPGDVPVTYADTTRLQEWVGFTPSTSLKDGLMYFRDWLLSEWTRMPPASQTSST
ncbi:MAG: NAD-dependent epimerase/dehydratase family protein [Burkholderiaceae bacterium]